MSKFDHPWKKHFSKNKPPEKYIEDYLIKLEKLDSAEFEFWKDFQKYLMEEREKRFSDIQSALEKAQKFNLQETFSRIVLSEYNDDPLCVYGSICEPGRFNFGALPSYYGNFGALYLGNNQQTAYVEKFHNLETETFGDGFLSASELALDSAPSHLYVRVNVSIQSYLDLRTDEALIGFLDAVKDIQPTKEFKQRWKSLCKKTKRSKVEQDLKMVREVEHLRALIFDPKFKQWISWLDCPSHSQWLGHYALKCGIQGIIFPSVRNDSGYNIAIFTDNFKESMSSIKLVDTVASVPSDRTFVNASNYVWFSKPLSEIRQLTLTMN
jgi:hypothetical protein